MSPFLSVRCLLLLGCLVVSHSHLYMGNACRNSVTYLFGPDAGIFTTSGDHPRPTFVQHDELSYQMLHDSHTDDKQLRQALGNATRMLNNIDACRSGYRLYKNVCYKAFTQAQDWVGAFTTCLNEECGQLAMPRTEDIDKFLISLKNAADPKSNFWFGLKRRGTKSKRDQFHWAGNASDIMDMNNSYTNWAPGRPNDEVRLEDCVLYVAKTSEFPDTWDHDRCFTTKIPFLCSTKPLGNPACPFCKA